MGYREQLGRKRERVVAALAAHPALAATTVEDVIGSRDLFGYRNVAKLAVRAKHDGSLRAGVYEPGTHRLADAEGCEVQHPAINEVIGRTLDEASALGLSAFDEERGEGDLRYLVARYSHWQRRVLLVLVTGRREERGGDLHELIRRVARRCRSLGGAVQNVNPERGNVILGNRWATLRPPAALAERMGFLKLETSPGSFLQVNTWTARRIYERAVEWLAPRPSDRIVDVYCGVGPLSLYLAAAAKEVYGVEEAPAAVRDARANAARNALYNARFHAGPAEEVLPALRTSLGGIDLATLNPPRKGVAAAVLAEISALGPRRILYVSCNPESLARDLARLHELGYACVRIGPFDMMPQTDHVEVVALCERQGERQGTLHPSFP